MDGQQQGDDGAQQGEAQEQSVPGEGEGDLVDELMEALEGEQGHSEEQKPLAVNAADLIRRSDRAMYQAKRRGKNRVELYGESRRSFQRLAVVLDGTFSPTTSETYPLQTLDLSEGGIRFVSERQLPVQSLVDVSITLPPDCEIAFAGRVVQSAERGEGGWEMALAILDIGARDRRDLAQFLRDQGRRD